MPDDLPPSAITRFDAPPTDLRAACAAAVRARLDALGVIAVHGPDAVSFLQSQLTSDVAALAADGWQRSGYCTAKGRLFATFTAWRDADAVYLQLPRELLPAVLKRLGMFVLRAKATLADVSAAWPCTAVFGRGAETVLARVIALPLAPGQAASLPGGARVLRLADGPAVGTRCLVFGDAGAFVDGTTEVAEGAWWWAAVDAGEPEVFRATQEAFVPQMINFEVLGGVNFRKGCYPGQEVVARSQYLGKLRRRMAIAHTAAAATLGADVVDAGGNAVGTVVLAAAAPDGGTDLLFESPVERQSEPLAVAGQPDGVLTLRPLPYELRDVTA